MARDKRTISEKIRKKLVALATGAAIVVGLAQAPVCLAEEYTVDKMQVPSPELCSTPDEAFKKIQERNFGEQNIAEVFDMSEVVSEPYKDSLSINTFHGKDGVKEFILKNQQYKNIVIAHAENLDEFNDVNEFMDLLQLMNRNSESCATLSIKDSPINDLLWKTEYPFDDNKNGQMYKKIVIEKLQKEGYDVSYDKAPVYKHITIPEIQELKLDNEDIKGMTKAEVIEFSNYITKKTKTSVVNAKDMDMEFSTKDAPEWSIITSRGEQFLSKYGDVKLLPQAECRDDVFVNLEFTLAKGRKRNYKVTPNTYNKVVGKFKQEGIVSIDMFGPQEGLYVKDITYINNVEKGLEYRKSTEVKETAFINNVFENEDMGVCIDESESQESQVLVMLNEYVETDEDDIAIENDNEGLEQENV